MNIQEKFGQIQYQQLLALKNIQEGIDEKNLEKIEKAVQVFIEHIKLLNRFTNIEKVTCLITQVVNQLMHIIFLPYIREYACEDLKENLHIEMENINFEKQILSELKQYFKIASKRKDYSYAPLASSLLFVIVSMHASRNSKSQTDVDMWCYELKGVHYIPAKTNDDSIETSKKIIEKEIKKLQKSF